MDKKINKKDVLWSYSAQFFNIGSGILLLPFVLNLLPEDILGVWYIFLMIGSFALMLDFGFQSTFARNVAYIFSGATQLQAKGIDENAPLLEHPNYSLLKTIIRTMRRFYGLVAVAQIILLATIGTWYVGSRITLLSQQDEIYIAWFIYILSVVVNFFYSYYNALLIGRGFVKEYNQLTIIAKSAYLAMAAIGLIYGYGLLAIAVANLFSVIINRVFAVIFFYKQDLRQILRKTCTTNINLLPIVWINARKVGLGSIGGFFVQKGNLLFISLFLPLNVVASFGLTTQIINILSGLSPLYLSTHLPDLYRSRVNKDNQEIKRIFGESMVIFTALYLCGAIVILLGGNYILELFHSQTLLIPFLPLSLLLIFQFLEINHGLAATLISTKNEIPYVKAALISGGTIGVFSAMSLAFTPLGVLGVILSTGLVQLCYNNWKWPMIVCKDLNTNYISLMKVGVLSLNAWFHRHFRKHK